MTRIGDLGIDHSAEEPSAEPDTFGWFGSDIRINRDGATDLAFIDFLEEAVNVGEESAEAVLLIKGYLRELVDPDDFDEFWRLARRHRQTTRELMLAAAEVVAAVVGRPSQPSSDSPDGRSPTGGRSKDGSSSRAMDRLHGRPDLQNVIVMAAERQERQAS